MKHQDFEQKTNAFVLQHPLAFSVSIAFEQTYGGIDGDSASAAELCCLLSALTGIAIKQSMAITGAVDQHGNILPIGGATEKLKASMMLVYLWV